LTYEQAKKKIKVTDIFALKLIRECIIPVTGNANSPKSTHIFTPACKYVRTLNWRVLSIHFPSSNLSAKCIGSPQANIKKKASVRLIMVEAIIRHHAAILCDGIESTRKKESPRDILMSRIDQL
jgi:hypothetical protein